MDSPKPDVNEQHMRAMGLDPQTLGREFTAQAKGCAPCKQGKHAECLRAVDIHEQGGHMAGEDGYIPSPRCVCYDSQEDEHDAVLILGKGHDPDLLANVICHEKAPHPQHEHVVLGYKSVCLGVEEPTKQREGDQRLPSQNDFPDIQSEVIFDIEQRRQVGIQRYGTALQPFNGRKTLLDAYEESLDQTVYLRSLLTMQEASRDVLVAVAKKVMVQQWLIAAENKVVGSPEDHCQVLAEVAVDAIIDAFSDGVVSDQ